MLVGPNCKDGEKRSGDIIFSSMSASGEERHRRFVSSV